MNKEYTILFNAITDVLCILAEAQQQAEELYIERPAPQIIDYPDDPTCQNKL